MGVEADDRREDRVAVLVGQDDGQAVADDGDLAVGRPQVNADDRFHGSIRSSVPVTRLLLHDSLPGGADLGVS